MAGRVTLDELYVLVPSTEELDLAEEAEVERLHGRLVKEYAALLGALDDDPLPGAPPGGAPAGTGPATDAEDRGDPDDRDSPDAPEWRPSDAQALGCLEHLLGARVVPPEDDMAAGADPDSPDDDPPTTPPTTPPATPPGPLPAPDGTAEDPAD
jgi:hypothetical protein